MKAFLAALKGALRHVRAFFAPLGRRFAALPRAGKIAVIAVATIVIIGGFALLRGAETPEVAENLRSVTLRSVAELSGAGSAGSVLGSVEARSEADIRSETGGTVVRVNASVGDRVGAGAILIELENASERAAVLQAEGAYDAALASRRAASPEEVSVTARNTYRSAFASLDATLEGSVDDLFGVITPAGPDLLINPPGSDSYELSRERARIDDLMERWRQELPSAESRNPEALLSEADVAVRDISAFVDRLVEAANRTGSGASAEQKASAAAARTAVNAVLTSLSSARTAYQSGATSSTDSVDASVKSALGSLRLAEANLEKTRIRAPIAGVVNFLPAKVGDYLTAFEHVATVAENSALEIAAFVSEEERDLLSVGMTVTVDDSYEGVVTSIAPALDPVTRQIEVRVALNADTALVNGQSVRVALPAAPSAEASEGPLYLPLASVKLRGEDRVVFTIGEDGRLDATAIETGTVRGDAIEILTPLDPSLRIVSDARGLAEGERVNVAP